MSRVLFWITVVPLFLVVIVFSVSNYSMAQLSLWPVLTDPLQFPVYGIALGGLFVGFLVGGAVSWIQNGRTRHRLRELQRQAERDQSEKDGLRERLARLEQAERDAAIPTAPAVAAGTELAPRP